MYLDETYLLIEKDVAEREIFKNHVHQFHSDLGHDEEDYESLTCQLTLPRGYHFCNLPYGLVVRKEASPDLIPFMNQRYALRR